MSSLSWEQQATGPWLATSSLADVNLSRALRSALFHLAAEQDGVAAAEAARVPYWQTCPTSVTGLRMAARALRDLANTLPMPLPESIAAPKPGSSLTTGRPSAGGESGE